MPAVTIPEHHVKQFDDNVFFLAQQKFSKLRSLVMIDTDFVGTRKAIDSIGSVSGQEHTTRFAPVVFSNPTHLRRWLSLRDYSLFTPVDELDKLRMLYDPTNKYAQLHAMWLGRLIDQAIIDALDATVVTGADEAGTEAFDATNFQIAVNYVESGAAADSNLTVGKLRRAQTLLDTNEIEQEGRVIIASPNNRQALLRDNTVTSSDYMTVKALVNGQIDTFLGFKFVWTNMLDKDSNNVRDVYALQAGGMILGMPKAPLTEVEKRVDLIRTWQVGTTAHLGAVRKEQGRVVKILADEDL